MITRSLTPDTFFANALPVLEEIVYSTMEQYPDIIPMLANVRQGTGWGAQTTEQSGTGPVVEIAEGSSVSYDDIVQGNSQTFTFTKFGLGVIITEEMIDDQKFDQVGDIYRGLGVSMHHTRQTDFMNNFNNGFATNGYDGVPLFSTAHPLVKAGGTENNRPTTDADLSEASLRTALNDIASTVSHEGLRIYVRPKTLLVHTTNVYTAHELLKSDLRPGTANNDANAFNLFGLSYMTSEYLTDTDSWYVLADKSEHKLLWYNRKMPEVKSFEDFDAGALKTKNTARWDTGHASWYGTYGNTGSP